jgi:hypothetical protein
MEEFHQCALSCIDLRAEGRSEGVVRGLRSLRDCDLGLLGVMEGTEGRRQTHSKLQVFDEIVGDNMEEELIFLRQKWYMLRHDDSRYLECSSTLGIMKEIGSS